MLYYTRVRTYISSYNQKLIAFEMRRKKSKLVNKAEIECIFFFATNNQRKNLHFQRNKTLKLLEIHFYVQATTWRIRFFFQLNNIFGRMKKILKISCCSSLSNKSTNFLQIHKTKFFQNTKFIKC